jgi:hypothetical protein
MLARDVEQQAEALGDSLDDALNDPRQTLSGKPSETGAASSGIVSATSGVRVAFCTVSAWTVMAAGGNGSAHQPMNSTASLDTKVSEGS